MEIIKFNRIVSVNSELQGHSAQSILDGKISPNKSWMCEKGTEKAVVILQLERAVVLTSIHVGNAHSAFVEILVGKAADSSDQFESLVPMSVFMNPHESKTGTNPNRTRFFNKEDFSKATTAKSWDRIKVVCSQPFNKSVPYGLCFLVVHGEKEAKKTEIVPKTDDTDEIEIGSFFRKRSSGGEKTLTGSDGTSPLKQSPLSSVKASEKLSSGSKPKSVEEETGEREKKKSGEETPKRKKDGSTSEVIPRKKKELREEEKTLKRKAHKRAEDKKPPKAAKEEERESEKKRRKKPFEKLMEDVVLVISGFKNPLRGNIRSMALEMGAKYSADWEPNCTHLVCAYENTPKFQKVKGKGKIVKKNWVEKCHSDRKRYPWRRFALDKADLKKPESEDEVEAEEEPEPEEEEEQVASCSKFDAPTHEIGASTPRNSKSGGDDYDQATDVEEENIVDTTDYPMPHLPELFSLKTFYIDPNLKSKAILERYIVAYNGILADAFHEDVDFYITDKGGAPLKLFRKKAPNLVAVKPSWIWEINSEQKYISATLHLVE